MLLSLLALVVVFACRLLAGLYYGYSALVLEAYHALIDVVIDCVILASVLIVRSGFSRRFPYGLFKLEDLAAVGVSAVILAVVAEELLSGSLWSTPKPRLIPVAVQAATIPGVLLSAWLKEATAKAYRSPSLHADAVHTLVDAVEGGFVAAGLAAYMAFKSVVAYVASLVAAIAGLCWASYEAGRDSLLSLLDLPRDRSLVGRILEVATVASRGEAEPVSVRVRWAGPVVFVELTLRMNPLATVDEAGRIARRVVEEVKKRIEGVEEVVVSIEPTVRSRLIVAVPVDEPKPNALVSEHFGRAQYYVIALVEGDGVKETRVVENPLRSDRHDVLVGVRLAEELHEMGVTDVIVRNIGEVAYGLLLRHRIMVWRAPSSVEAIRAVEMLVRGELERMVEPTHEKPWRYPHGGP